MHLPAATKGRQLIGIRSSVVAQVCRVKVLRSVLSKRTAGYLCRGQIGDDLSGERIWTLGT